MNIFVISIILFYFILFYNDYFIMIFVIITIVTFLISQATISDIGNVELYARVFSQIQAHGNSKNELRQKHRGMR